MEAGGLPDKGRLTFASNPRPFRDCDRALIVADKPFRRLVEQIALCVESRRCIVDDYFRLIANSTASASRTRRLRSATAAGGCSSSS
jgi:hypothetical protein